MTYVVNSNGKVRWAYVSASAPIGRAFLASPNPPWLLLVENRHRLIIRGNRSHFFRFFIC